MKDTSDRKQIIVGVTGASGAPYSRRLIQCLCDSGADVHLIVTPNGKRLLAEELDIHDISAATLLGPTDEALGVRSRGTLSIHPYRDVGSVLGSGSFHADGMVVCPCSSNTLASIAVGLSNNLLDRAAFVTLKESRRLIVLLREMPMSRIDLLNALKLSEAGAIICPASPGFYMRPQQVADLVDFVVGKVLDLIDVPHSLHTRWADQLEDSKHRARTSREG